MSIGYWQSLAGRLFKLVFSSYLGLAILVTGIQLGIEYSTIQKLIGNDLASLGNSFKGGVAEAMWELDRPLLQTMAKGIAQSSIVTGVQISSQEGIVFSEIGEIPSRASPEAGRLLASFQSDTTALRKKTPLGVRELGTLRIFSNRSVALERIKYSFIVIVINSLVKTAGLWGIFYVVITRGLSAPLSRLTEVVSQIKFASESREAIPLEYPHKDELGTLAESMNKMQERLADARRELEEVNAHLEETVAERTQRLSEALHFSETILLGSPLPMGVYNAAGKCALVNNAYAALFRTTREILLNLDLIAFDTVHKTGLREHCLDALSDHQPRQFESMMFTSSGEPLWLECRILPSFTNGEDHLLLQFIDLTERKLIEEELRHKAFYDFLTRLPNRRLLQERLSQALRTSRRQNSHVAVIFIDLNKFKQLNDTYGHEAGDRMLIEVADRLKHALRDTDTIARIGGDEFVVLLEGLGAGPEQARQYAESVASKINEALSREYRLGDIRYPSSASIGIKVFLGDDMDPDRILREADEAMYKAKRAGAG